MALNGLFTFWLEMGCPAGTCEGSSKSLGFAIVWIWVRLRS